MPSTWGRRHGLEGYDEFRINVSFADARAMLWVESPDSRHWRRKRRGSVLGLLHSLKLSAYDLACAQGYLEQFRERKKK